MAEESEESKRLIAWLMSPTKRDVRRSNEDEVTRYAGFPMGGATKNFHFWLNWRNKITEARKLLGKRQ